MKKIEEEEVDDISEPEDPMMLSRDAKDWKVRRRHLPGLELLHEPF